MAATLSPVPKLQFFDANGAPLAGGKLYSYFAGTTTPQSTYTDSTGTTSNPNPVILDARGEAGVWLANDAFYKLSLYTSTDVLVWTVDQIASNTTLAALAASGGSALVGYLPAGTGAVATTVQTKLRESVSVLDFADMQTAVTYCIANSKNLKLVGTINLTTQVIIDTTAAPAGVFTIYGDGATVTIPSGSTAVFNCTTFTAGGLSSQGVFLVKTPDTDDRAVVIEGIYFYKNNLSDAPYTGTWFNFQTQRNLTITHCVFNGAATAVMATEAYGLRFIDNTVTGFQQAVYLRGAANTSVIRDNRFRNGRQCIVATSQLLASTTVGILIDGNYFESTTLAAITFNGVRSSTVSNNYFEAVDQGLSYGGVACAIVMNIGVGTNIEPSSRNYFLGNYFNTSNTLYVWNISGSFNTFTVNTGFNYSGTDSTGLASWSILDNGGVFSRNWTGSFTPITPIAMTPLGAGWSNQGGTYAVAAYWKDLQGVVNLQGAITGGAADTTTPIYTLPVGYRPAKDHWLIITSNSAAGVLRVAPSGDITIRVGSGTSITSLTGLTFSTV